MDGGHRTVDVAVARLGIVGGMAVVGQARAQPSACASGPDW